MEHISQSNAEKFENGAVTSWEYSMREATLNLAPIWIRGRYPESGYTKNLVSDSIVHVMDGAGYLILNDGTSIALSQHDQVHLAKGDTYYFDGNLDIIYAATPPWTPGQTAHVE